MISVSHRLYRKRVALAGLIFIQFAALLVSIVDPNAPFLPLGPMLAAGIVVLWLLGQCTHEKVTILRWHKDVRRPDMIGKEIFVDVHNVYNFVACADCGKIFDGCKRGEGGYLGGGRDRLYAEQRDDHRDPP